MENSYPNIWYTNVSEFNLTDVGKLDTLCYKKAGM